MNKFSLLPYKVFQNIGKVALYILASFVVLTIILISLVCIISTVRRYSNKITDIYMQRIYIDNDTALANKKLYLVGAKTQKDKYELKIGFMINWRFYYPQSSDSICDVSIESTQGKRMNDKFVFVYDSVPINERDYDCFLLANDKDSLWVYYNEDRIYSHRNNCFKTRKILPNINVLIALEDSTDIPDTIRTKFPDREIIKAISNTPVHYKVIDEGGWRDQLIRSGN